MKKLIIPKELEADFINFLDCAQCNFPDSNDVDLYPSEKKLLKLIRKYLGKNLSRRG